MRNLLSFLSKTKKESKTQKNNTTKKLNTTETEGEVTEANNEVVGQKNKLKIFDNISDNVFYLKGMLKRNNDILFRYFYIGSSTKRGVLIYIEGMTNKADIENQVIKPLIKSGKIFNTTADINLDTVVNKLITSANILVKCYFDDLITFLLSGSTLLFIDGIASGIILGSKHSHKREVGVTTVEQTLRGPQEGFVDDFETNIIIVRRRIKDINFAVEFLKVGMRTQTNIAVLYLTDVAAPELVQEVKRRLSEINIDGIVGSAQIEQFLEERKWSVMPQMVVTERPDKAVSNILDGRVVVVVDGSPFVLVLPGTFAMMINSPEDSYKRSIVASFIRIIRYGSFIIATSFPGIYIALTAYHPGMLPTQLALSIAGTRVGLPFPLYLEVFFMEIIIDVIQEAAIRLPKPIGPTISIIGGIILSQAVVQAGIVSPIIVIIVSLTAVSAFIFPIYTVTQSTRILRFIIILAASFLGLFGTMIAWIFIIIYLASMENFGVRYLEDYSPFNFQKLKDTIVKVPISYLKFRPDSSRNINKKMNNTKKGRQ